MPQSVRAVVVDPSHGDKLTLQSVALPSAAPDERLAACATSGIQTQ